jgi:hypothetical protein
MTHAESSVHSIFEPTKSTHPKIGKFASIGGYSDICEPRKARKIPVTTEK